MEYKDTSAFGELVNKNGLILKSGKSPNELSMSPANYRYLLLMKTAVDPWSNIFAMELPSPHIPSLIRREFGIKNC